MRDREHDGSFGGFLAGFLLGGLVGAGLALVLTPRTGESLRRAIRDQALEAKASVLSLVEEASELISKLGTAVPSGGDKESAVRRRIEELRDQLDRLQTSTSQV